MTAQTKGMAEKDERSAILDAAVEEEVATIEQDGAETIILGCSTAY